MVPLDISADVAPTLSCDGSPESSLLACPRCPVEDKQMSGTLYSAMRRHVWVSSPYRRCVSVSHGDKGSWTLADFWLSLSSYYGGPVYSALPSPVHASQVSHL